MVIFHSETQVKKNEIVVVQVLAAAAATSGDLISITYEGKRIMHTGHVTCWST